MNGVDPGALIRGTVALVLAHGVPGLGEDSTGSMVEITVGALHLLPLLTQKTALRHPRLKARVEVPDFGQAWRREEWVRISTTEPRNLVRNRNKRHGIGRDQWRDHRGGSVNPNRNQRLHLDGDRIRGLMTTEVKDPRTSAQ